MEPSEISVDVTYACPFTCAFCSTARKLRGEMRAETVRHVSGFLVDLRRAHGRGANVAVTGGEPLLFPDLLQTLAAWQDDCEIFTLCTTGATQTEPGFWEQLARRGVKVVRLSLHAAAPEAAQRVFGRNYRLPVVLENARAAVEAGLVLHANFLLSSLTIGNVTSVIPLCRDLGVQTFRILGLAQQGRAVENWSGLAMPAAESTAAAHAAGYAARARGMSIEFAGLPDCAACSHSDSSGECAAGRSFFHINADGDVYGCPAAKSVPGRRLGRVHEPLDRILSRVHVDRQPACVFRQDRLPGAPLASGMTCGGV